MLKKDLSELQEVELGEIWPNEARDFTPWLATEGWELLCTQIGTEEIERVDREVPIGDFYTDILAQETGTGRKIVIENQLGKTDHDHLGKIITYASGHDAAIVVWIFKEIREEHRQAIDWLNEISDENTSFFALVIKVYQIDGSKPAPKFETICKPNEWSRELKGTKGDTKIGRKQREFWKKLKDFASSKNVKYFTQQSSAQNWYAITVGTGKATVILVINSQKHLMRCQFKVTDNSFFEFLEGNKKDITDTLGYAEWLPKKKSWVIEQEKGGFQLDDEEKYETYFAWFVEKASLFVQTFQPYVESFKPPPSSEESSDDED